MIRYVCVIDFKQWHLHILSGRSPVTAYVYVYRPLISSQIRHLGDAGDSCDELK